MSCFRLAQCFGVIRTHPKVSVSALASTLQNSQAAFVHVPAVGTPSKLPPPHQPVSFVFCLFCGEPLSRFSTPPFDRPIMQHPSTTAPLLLSATQRSPSPHIRQHVHSHPLAPVTNQRLLSFIRLSRHCKSPLTASPRRSLRSPKVPRSLSHPPVFTHPFSPQVSLASGQASPRLQISLS